MTSNPLRSCIGCGQRDDHPRHVVDNGSGNDVAWHMDCHVLSANGCEICAAQIADVPAGTIGQELRDHLLATGPAPDQPGWTAPDEVSVDG